MKFTFLTIGKIKEKWMRQGIDEYLKRLSPIAKVEILSPDEEKMPENPSPALKEKVMEKEGEKLLKYLKDEDFLILLDLKGKPVTSEELADILRKRMVSGTSHFFFMIGGPYGNGENIRKRANLKISISAIKALPALACSRIRRATRRAKNTAGNHAARAP